MIKYARLSKDDKLKKASIISNLSKIEINDEYLAMKNELNNISSIKNNYIIALFAGIIAFWGYALSPRENYVAFLMVLPQFFIYLIQDKLMMLTDLHIRIQAQIWVTYNSVYESSYIPIFHEIYGDRKQTFFSRLRKIPAFYMGSINVMIVLIMTIYTRKDDNDMTQWYIVLGLVVITQIVIFIKFWNFRNGELLLIAYAEEMMDNSEINQFKEEMNEEDDKNSVQR